MNKSLFFIYFFILCFFFSQSTNSAIMVEDGPDVGEVAPDFTLKDINGKDFTLSSFKKIKPVVLFFGSCT